MPMDTYSKNLQKMSEAKQKRQNEEQKYQLEVLKLQQKDDESRRKQSIDLELNAAKQRNLDKQSEKAEAETLATIRQQYLTQRTTHTVDKKAETTEVSNNLPAMDDLKATPPTADQIANDPGNPNAASFAPPSQEAADPLSSGVASQINFDLGGGGVSPPKVSTPDFMGLPSTSEVRAAADEFLGKIKGFEQDRKDVLNKQEQEYKDYQTKVWDTFSKAQDAANYTRSKMDNLQTRLRTLNENPPLRQQAVANVNFFGKVSSVIHAAMQGYLQGYGVVSQNAPLLIDQLVEKEYNDIVSKYNAEKDTIGAEFNLLKQTMEWDNDETTAKMALHHQLYGMVQKQFENQLKNIDMNQLNEKQKLDIQATLHALDTKYAQGENALKSTMFNIQASQRSGGLSPKDAMTLHYKAKADKRAEDKLALDKKAVTITGVQGGYSTSLTFADKAERKEVSTALGSGRKSLFGAKQILSYASKLGGIKALSAKFAKSGWEKSKSALADFQNLQRTLVPIMLNHRIAFTGGGNMSDQERKVLWEYFLVGDDKATIESWLKQRAGEYGTLVSAIQKNAINESHNKLWASSEYRALSRQDKILTLADNLNISAGEAAKLAGKLNLDSRIRPTR